MHALIAGNMGPRSERNHRRGLPILLLAFAFVLLLAGGTACTSKNAASPSEAGTGEAGICDAIPGDGSSADGRPTACSSADDCLALGPSLVLGPPVCCLANACVWNPPNDLCSDASVQLIQASSSDQSCTTDTDCVVIAEGNGCDVSAFDCPNAAINKGGYAQYQSDIAKTPSAWCYAPSGCPNESGPCCRGGKCQVGSGCFSPADTLPACADAGGTCSPFVTSCGKAGPPDACAYSDEMCCVN